MAPAELQGNSSREGSLLYTNNTNHYMYVCMYVCIYIYIYSLVADSSDKGSHGHQKKSKIESNVTLQILSTVDSTGKNIGARKFQRHNVTTIVRNGRFVRPDHRTRRHPR